MHGGLRASGSQAYVGTDRRQRLPGRDDDVRGQHLVWLSLGLVSLGVGLPVVARAFLTESSTVSLVEAQRGIVTALFLGAGLLHLARWRLTGESRTALRGVALTAFALNSYPLAPIGSLVYADRAAAVLNPVARAIAVLVCVTTLTRAFGAPEVDSRLRPGRMVATAVGSAWLAYLALAAGTGTLGRLQVDDHVWAGLELVLMLAWVYVAARALFAVSSPSDVSLSWCGLGLATMAGGELVRSQAFVHLLPAVLSSTGLQLVAAFVAAATATRDLGQVFSVEGNRFLAVASTLALTEQILATNEQRHLEQVHDSRSVIAALRAASLTLERYGDRLDPADRHTLRSSFTRELVRLEHLIEPPPPAPVQDFSVDDALGPVIAAEREAGLTVDVAVHGLTAHGRSEDLATVVQNLLVNARRYAPGSTVALRGRLQGPELQITVEDRGPGVAAGEREAVFDRGVRGSDAAGVPGSGLGLYVARSLMREQGGDLIVTDRPGGGATFVVTLLGGEPVPTTSAAGAVAATTTGS